MNAKQTAVAFVSGLLFSVGLVVSGMTDPRRVIGFLDVAGDWDPTLAFVMGGALMVTIPSFWWIRRRARPLADDRFHVERDKAIDGPLAAGAVLFGIGWGIAGFCPGPAIVSLASGIPGALAFGAAMLGGMAAVTWLRRAPRRTLARAYEP